METNFTKLLEEKKTKLTGKEALSIASEMSRVLEAHKNKKSWTIQKLSDQFGVTDVKFVQRLLRLAQWPCAAQKFIIDHEQIDFPFLRVFLDKSWNRSDTLLVALNRKLLDEKPRKKNTLSVVSDYEKLRRVHIKNLTYIELLREENKKLKDEVRQLEAQDYSDDLLRENRHLKDTIVTLNSLLTKAPLGAHQKAPYPPALPPNDDADLMYVINFIKSRYGVRPSLEQKTFRLTLECMTDGGLDKILEKLMS